MQWGAVGCTQGVPQKITEGGCAGAAQDSRVSPSVLQQVQDMAAEYLQAVEEGPAQGSAQDGAAAVVAFIPKCKALGEALTAFAVTE